MCFIIWGKKAAQKYPMGYVAEHCSHCGGAQAMQINSLNQADHIYYISLGRGKLLGYVGVCQQCSSNYYLDPINYNDIPKRCPTNLFELIQQTSPRFDNSNPQALDAWRRTASLRRPLQAANATLRDRYKDGSSRFDRMSLLVLVAAVAVPLLLYFGLDSLKLSDNAADTSAQVCWGIFAAGFVAFIVTMASEQHRFFRRQVLPVAAAALKPLNPTLQELESSLGLMKKYKHYLPRLTKPATLLRAVEATSP